MRATPHLVAALLAWATATVALGGGAALETLELPAEVNTGGSFAGAPRQRFLAPAEVWPSWNVGGTFPGGGLNAAVASSSDGGTVAVGTPSSNSNTNGAVQVWTYDDDLGNWTQRGADLYGEALSDEFGASVALSADGRRVVIGAPKNDGANGGDVDSGHVRVYEWDEDAGWKQMGGDVDGEATEDMSGASVALSASGTRLAVGAPRNLGGDEMNGHVRVYDWNGSTKMWEQAGSDLDGETSYDRSGGHINLAGDGNRLAIGAHGNKGSKGHVRVYDWSKSGRTWEQKGGDIDGEVLDDQSGGAVALSGDGRRVAIGAKYNDNGNGGDSGHVRVYEWDGDTTSDWKLMGAVDLDGEAAGDQSGSSVALSADGGRVAIGSPYNGGGSGHVRMYEWDGAAWKQVGADIDGEGSDGSGVAVALSADGTRIVAATKGGVVRTYFPCGEGYMGVGNECKRIPIPRAAVMPLENYLDRTSEPMTIEIKNANDEVIAQYERTRGYDATTIKFYRASADKKCDYASGEVEPKYIAHEIVGIESISPTREVFTILCDVKKEYLSVSDESNPIWYGNVDGNGEIRFCARLDLRSDDMIDQSSGLGLSVAFHELHVRIGVILEQDEFAVTEGQVADANDVTARDVNRTAVYEVTAYLCAEDTCVMPTDAPTPMVEPIKPFYVCLKPLAATTEGVEIDTIAISDVHRGVIDFTDYLGMDPHLDHCGVPHMSSVEELTKPEGYDDIADPCFRTYRVKMLAISGLFMNATGGLLTGTLSLGGITQVKYSDATSRARRGLVQGRGLQAGREEEATGGSAALSLELELAPADASMLVDEDFEHQSIFRTDERAPRRWPQHHENDSASAAAEKNFYGFTDVVQFAAVFGAAAVILAGAM